jgi:cytidylate kinase
MKISRPSLGSAGNQLERGASKGNTTPEIVVSAAEIDPLATEREGEEIEATAPGRQGGGPDPGPHLVIAIDGPAAAGKTTVANELARRIDALMFDTGVIYRALALASLEAGVDPDDGRRLAEMAEGLPLAVERPSIADGRTCDVLLDGRDVTWAIRAPEVDRIVSAVSAHPAVRAALLALQRAIGRSGRVVMVGRDIGTVIMPDADVKIWLDASLDERARRRTLDLARLGQPASFDDVRAEMLERDRFDAQRSAAPMRPATDAVIIPTDGLSVEEVVNRIAAQLGGRDKNGAGA